MLWPRQSDPSDRMRSPTRATAPVIGGLLMIALTLIVATVAASTLFGFDSTPEPAPPAAVDLSVDGTTLRFTHESGEPLDVQALSVRISVDGEPLAEQPPVPFFSASGFEPGPTGPFNTASDSEWEVGETTTLTVAGTNSPTLEEGSTVSVRITTETGSVIRIDTTV